MRAVWSRDARVLTVQVALPFVDRVEGVGLGAVATLAVVLGRQLLQHRLTTERGNVTHACSAECVVCVLLNVLVFL